MQMPYIAMHAVNIIRTWTVPSDSELTLKQDVHLNGLHFTVLSLWVHVVIIWLFLLQHISDIKEVNGDLQLIIKIILIVKIF